VTSRSAQRYRTPSELWNSLSLTGNWKNRKLDANGDGDFGDEEDRDEPLADQTFTKANEWTDRKIAKASGGGADHDTYDYTHDAVGNLTVEDLSGLRGATSSLGRRGFVYDAFGRMVTATGIIGEEGPVVTARHRYNGLGFRIMWQYDADSDINFDGSEDSLDGDLFYFDSYLPNSGLSGKGKLSSPAVGNRIGYAGYQWDPTIKAYHVRHRVLLPEIGRWSRRDPIGYVDGMRLYEYCGAMAVQFVDSMGLQVATEPPDPHPCTIALELERRKAALEEAILDACGLDSDVQEWAAIGRFAGGAFRDLLEQAMAEAEIGFREARFRALKAAARASRRGLGWRVYLANLDEARNSRALHRAAKCIPLVGDLYTLGCGIANDDSAEQWEGACSFALNFLPGGRIGGIIGDVGLTVINVSSDANKSRTAAKQRAARRALALISARSIAR